ncbi:hypothetical protein KRX54_00955 [Actinomycetaceae bacterium TAE3-ERU4]|nr:hypothetical protein [Actinomycetaceae bacterium TAE3-ERU4]
MIKIDASTPEPLLPLSWLIDSWEGYGMLLPETSRLQELNVEVVDNHLRLTFSFTQAEGWVPPSDTALEGRAQLKPVKTASLNETYEVFVSQTNEIPEDQRHTPGECQVILTINQIDTQSNLIREWVGVAQGPRIQMQSLGGVPEEEKGLGKIRMFGLVGGELMWTESTFSTAEYARAISQGRELNEEETTATATGRLARKNS